MKAMVYEKYGPPDVLELKEIEKPSPKDNEVLIKVHATTVNRTDCGFLRAKPFIVRFFSGLLRPKNTILGNEFAGEIEAVGKDVTSFKAGEKVFGFSDDFGAHAEYITMPEDGVLAIMPSRMTYEQAAPSNEGAHYALVDIKAAHIESGQKVLINGATGAIGSSAVQLVKYIGADVTAVCDTKRIDMVKALGADRIIDYTKEDFTKLDEKFDVVFDAAGKSWFFKCRRLLKPGGYFVSTELGPFLQNPLLALWTAIFGSLPAGEAGFGGKKALFPIPRHRKEYIEYFKKLIEEGKFKPVIDRTYPLEEVAEAFRYVETGEKTGNVVITVL